MTGDGLRFALRGGELAAHAALRALERGAIDLRQAAELAQFFLRLDDLRKLIEEPRIDVREIKNLLR